jgi:gamma-glutamyltranspeptidase/glutathione hydrolase
MLAPYELTALAPADRVHLTIEAMRRAYRDRAEFLGDPDQVDVPVARLTHPYYAAGLMRDFDMGRATPSRPGATPRAAGADTTHVSILDASGNRVAATLSINYPFGAAFVPPGTGVLLNDEMDDFAAQPGVPNAYGLVGGAANAIAPGKRMLSSMSPTFIESDDAVVILGTPGGSRIITMVLHGILAATDGHGDAAAWVAAPRYHHQFLPDEVLLEPEALSPAVRRALRERGHRLSTAERPYGNMQLIHWDRATSRVEAASDPRGLGAAQVIGPLAAWATAPARPAAVQTGPRPGAEAASQTEPQREPLRATP